jgi:hypothetical protein
VTIAGIGSSALLGSDLISDFMKNAIKQTEYIPHDGESVHRPESVAEEAVRLRAENARLREAGSRMAEMLALAPGAPVADRPTDDQIMDAVQAWHGLVLPNVQDEP